MLDRIGGTFESVSGDLAEDGFELGEHLFDWIEVRAVSGKVEKNGATRFDGFLNSGDLMHRNVVHEHDLAFLQGRSQDLLDVGSKCLAVHRAFEYERRRHPVVAQRGDEGRGLPVAVQNLVDQAFAARGAAIEASDIVGDAGFIDENQSSRIKLWLLPSQGSTIGRDVWSILLGGVKAFF